MDTNERMTGAKIIQNAKVNPPAGGQKLKVFFALLFNFNLKF